MNSVNNDILSGRGLKPLPRCTYAHDGTDYEFDRMDLNWFFCNNDIVRQVCDKTKSLGRNKDKGDRIKRFFKRNKETIMSGGRFEYADMTAKNMIFNYDKCTNVFEDREISELVWDVFDLIHDFDWYKSGDTDKSDYLKAKRAFKKKWFENRGVRARRIIDEAVAELKRELYETYDLDIKDVPKKINTKNINDNPICCLEPNPLYE